MFVSVSECLFGIVLSQAVSLPVFVSVFVLVCFSLSVSFSVIALTLLEDRQAGATGLAVEGEGWCGSVVVRKGGGGGGGSRAGAASQPLPSGDPDVRP